LAIKRLVRKVLRATGTGRYSLTRRLRNRKVSYGLNRKYLARDIKKARKTVRSTNTGPEGRAWWEQQLAKLKKKGARMQKREVQVRRITKKTRKRQGGG